MRRIADFTIKKKPAAKSKNHTVERHTVKKRLPAELITIISKYNSRFNGLMIWPLFIAKKYYLKKHPKKYSITEIIIDDSNIETIQNGLKLSHFVNLKDILVNLRMFDLRQLSNCNKLEKIKFVGTNLKDIHDLCFKNIKCLSLESLSINITDLKHLLLSTFPNIIKLELLNIKQKIKKEQVSDDLKNIAFIDKIVKLLNRMNLKFLKLENNFLLDKHIPQLFNIDCCELINNKLDKELIIDRSYTSTNRFINKNFLQKSLHGNYMDIFRLMVFQEYTFVPNSLNLVTSRLIEKLNISNSALDYSLDFVDLNGFNGSDMTINTFFTNINNVKHLILSNTRISEHVLCSIAQKYRHSLRSLDIENVNISYDTLHFLKEILSNCDLTYANNILVHCD
ncbi:hypothetical protein EDEG_02143 [Edhazardia aedis USNM 41457]|uniref:Uncharacterized protein n=1 Tax=Edhazardia aedis (strain USNM 41457) TaxID=1003232 RepID=J9DQA6_EDHAE|nr:hypothetical protein EDEG_02143 [Edhazardia aedis USNM 41457]|eukprot:EJW03522.1 hypothetical protein EDEG_02143 [Edhazardia aedis USNM 41457]